MPLSLTLSLLMLSAPAQAVQLEWDGHYRARGLLYDSLSLSDSNDLAEGTSNLFDHRLRLQPRFYLSDRVGLFTQIDALSLVPWGSSPEAWVDPVTGDSVYLANDQTLVSPSTSQGITVSRAWGEIYADFGRISFGRVPLHWGTGIYLNDGLALDSEYGDTTDRIQITSRVGMLYLMAAYDMNYEGLINDSDEMQTVNGAVFYKSETMGVGFLNQYRYQPSLDFGAYTGDLWFEADLGSASIEAEVVGVFGSGDLAEDVNEVKITAVGAMLGATFELDRIGFGLEAGLASGDDDPDDSHIKTFSFDRDHNVAIMMFEEPMPTLAAATATEANGGRELDAVLTGEGVSNAMYLRPSAGIHLTKGLDAELALIGAMATKLPEDEPANSYGWELDASLTYIPYEHVFLKGGVGLFWPGDYYSTYEHTDLGTGFDKMAVGGMLQGVVHF